MRTRYTRLHEAWKNETKKKELQNISDNFLHEMKNYVNQLNKTSTEQGTLSGNLTRTERQYANQLLNELREKRLDKIIKSELNGFPIDAKAMTPEEQQLHSNIRQLLSGYRQGTEISQPRTQIKPRTVKKPVEKESHEVKPPSDEEMEMTLVRFVQPLPAIMGIDMKAYGPFQPEELATIPRQNAENLIKRGVAKKVDAEV